ncbi:hypothetical protein [Cohnella caldifontis]|uniref:hypothetical protein n=1 Tax=Cohnella caldifontis TaxID=3027471 RepID=UPI0023EBBAEA|nr:hypothetical protein [Cohnella sp. YIM B05605]
MCEIETYEQDGSYVKEHLTPELLAWAKGVIDQALEAPNAIERRKVLEKIEGRLREEALVLFLLHKKVNTSYQPGIRGVTMSPLGWIDFKSVWVQSRR